MSKFTNDMNIYKNTSSLFDIEIKCKDGTLYYSKYMLSLNSGYFNTLFKEQFSEKNITSVTLDKFTENVVSEYLYMLDNKTTMHISINNIILILQLMDFLESTNYNKILKLVTNCLYNPKKYGIEFDLCTDIEILNTLITLYNTRENINYNSNIGMHYANKYGRDQKDTDELLKNVPSYKIVYILSRGNVIEFLYIYQKWLSYHLNIENLLRFINTEFVDFIKTDIHDFECTYKDIYLIIITELIQNSEYADNILILQTFLNVVSYITKIAKNNNL